MLIGEKDSEFLQEMSSCENLRVLVMGKITITVSMVEKGSKAGETTVDVMVERMLGELPMKTLDYVPTVM